MFQFFFPSFLCVFDSMLPIVWDEDKITPFCPLRSYTLSPSEFRILSFLPWSSCKEDLLLKTFLYTAAVFQPASP